jgi:hypothetical protein
VRTTRKDDAKLANPAEVTAGIRDLIVHLHRGNSGLAESIVQNVVERLKELIQSEENAKSFPMQRAQQTMFAIDEVRILMAERDFNGAAEAARDAGKEWKQMPAPELGK